MYKSFEHLHMQTPLHMDDPKDIDALIGLNLTQFKQNLIAPDWFRPHKDSSFFQCKDLPSLQPVAVIATNIKTLVSELLIL